MCYTLNFTKEEQWRRLPWNKFNRQIREIQERIYDASVRNDSRSVRTLQKVLVGLTPAKFIAVRQVNKITRGKRIKRMDGISYLTPAQCIDLVIEIEIDGKTDYLCKVFSPKPDRIQVSLGISTMVDRAKQFLLLMALEPEWEARFEPNSYGFRPGRSCQDARAAICRSLKKKVKYVFDVNIGSRFPTIAHNPLLNKLNTIPLFRKQIHSWLKSEMKFERGSKSNLVGPSLSVSIFPFLLNVALHGLEEYVGKCLAKCSKNKEFSKTFTVSNGLVVRYANQFVILYPYLEVLEKVVIEVKKWLFLLGFEISKCKASIRHTLYNHNDNDVGFTFLGFYFSHKKGRVGTVTCVTDQHKSSSLRYSLSQKPDKYKVKQHIRNVRDIIKRMEKRPQVELIVTLNSIIHDWTNYYAFTDNITIFHYCDERLFYRLLRYACNRHPSKSKKWVIKNYFYKFEGYKWVFITPDRCLSLRRYSKRVYQNI